MNILEFIFNNKDYLEDLITRSTYHSNAIEGSTLTYAETYAILYNDNSFKIERKEPREIYEAINHKSALELVFNNLKNEDVFDERFIKRLNETINNKQINYSLTDELKKLKELYDNETITKEEFEKIKRDLLSK